MCINIQSFIERKVIYLEHFIFYLAKKGRSGSNAAVNGGGSSWKGGDTVLDMATSRRPGVDPGLASSPLITGKRTILGIF